MNIRSLVIDNGGCTCKIGWADGDAPTVVAPNATAHQRGVLDTLVGDQILKIKNQGTLQVTRPCERGIVTNWPVQVDIWQRLLPQAMQAEAGPSSSSPPPSLSSSSSSGSSSSPSFRDTALVVTVAPFTPAALTGNLDEIAFEHFGFSALSRLPGPCAAA